MNNKINILHVIESAETGGAESVFLSLVSGIDERKFNNYACLFESGWLEHQLVEYGIEPIIVNSSSSFDMKLLWSIMALVKKNNIDLIHSHLFGANVYCSVVGKMTGKPVVSTFHGMVDISSSERFSKVKVMLVNHFSKKNVFVSQQLRTSMCSKWRIKNEGAIVIHNGVDLKRFIPSPDGNDHNSIKKEYGWGEQEKIILSVGDVRPPKGYATLLQVASRMVENDSKIRFLIAGTKTSLYERYSEIIQKSYLSENVFFLGYREDVKELMECADIFYLPSISEGFSIATIEAMAMGLPVVATRSGGPQEIITHGKDGLLIPVGSVRSAIASLDKILTNVDLRQALSRRGRETIEKRFSMDSTINLYEKLYHSLIG